MKTAAYFTFILIGIFMNSVFAQAPDPERVVRLKLDKDPTVSFRVTFNAGSQFDPKGKEGLAYVTSQLLSEGSTTVLPYETILKKLFPLAASFYVSIGREITVFSGRVHKDNLKNYYPLFTQQVLHPAFLEKELDRIKADAMNYLGNDLKYSGDEELGKAILYGTIFEGTPYAHHDIGTISGLQSITLEDVKNFYATYYNRNNFILGIGGGFDEELLATLWNDLQKLPEGTLAEKPELNIQQNEGFKTVIVNKKTAATAISMGFPIQILRNEREWYALAVANSWLGEHRNSSSHLYQVIREKRGLNYGDYSYIEHFPNGGRHQMPPVNVPRRQQIFEIWIRPVPNEAAHFAIRAALREFRALIEKGMTEDQFKLTAGFLKNYVLHFAPTTSKRLGYALDDRFYKVDGSHLENFRKAMDELTVNDVNTAIRKYWQYDNMVISIIGAGAEELAGKLVNNEPSVLEYKSPKSADILAEDKEIAVYPLPFVKDRITILTVDELFK